MRWRFDGFIAGLGTESGTRLVVGLWPRSPFGPITDVMIEEPDGHRVLIAPATDVADFIATTYGFDELRVERIEARATPDGWAISSESLELAVDIGPAPRPAGCWAWFRGRWPSVASGAA